MELRFEICDLNLKISEKQVSSIISDGAWQTLCSAGTSAHRAALIFLPWTELLFMLQPRRSMLIRGQLGVCPHIWNWSGWPKQNEAEEKSAKWTLKAVIEEVPV